MHTTNSGKTVGAPDNARDIALGIITNSDGDRIDLSRTPISEVAKEFQSLLAQRDELLSQIKECRETSRRQHEAFNGERLAVMAANTKVRDLKKAVKALLKLQDTDSMFRLPSNCDELKDLRAAIASAEKGVQP